MSTVLHPVGPEPAQTYWVRRLAVLGVVVVVLAVIGALIANGTTSGSAVQPSPPPLVTAETPSPTLTASAPAASPTPATAAPVTAAAQTPPSSPVACAAGNLRPTLTGKQQLKPKQANTFTLSLINGSGQACVAQVTRDNFELKIYSGTDRIWSSRDCATAVKTMTRKLGPEQAVEWSMSWNGRRSRTGCHSRPEIPRPGTYYATAQLAGAKPVQLRMILVG